MTLWSWTLSQSWSAPATVCVCGIYVTRSLGGSNLLQELSRSVLASGLWRTSELSCSPAEAVQTKGKLDLKDPNIAYWLWLQRESLITFSADLQPLRSFIKPQYGVFVLRFSGGGFLKLEKYSQLWWKKNYCRAQIESDSKKMCKKKK